LVLSPIKEVPPVSLAPPGDNVRDGSLCAAADRSRLKLDWLAVGVILEHNRTTLHPFVAPFSQRR
jgi:hypothetical protein